ncbi:hypothetical protein GCM10027026_37700 [Myroides odoratimimus subsp. xuanwuensis]
MGLLNRGTVRPSLPSCESVSTEYSPPGSTGISISGAKVSDCWRSSRSCASGIRRRGAAYTSLSDGGSVEMIQNPAAPTPVTGLRQISAWPLATRAP